MFSLIRKDAADRKLTAGYDGEWTDRGASSLLENLSKYEDGMMGVIPKTWRDYYKKALKQELKEDNKKDPEWKEYSRLRKKFSLKDK